MIKGKIVAITAMMAAMTLGAGFATQANAGLSVANVCPSTGSATDCNFLISFGANGGITTSFGPQANYDNVEDALIGVTNNSGHTLSSFNISGTNIFGFEGDGINTYTNVMPVSGNPDTTGYGGPLGYFTNINNAFSSGTVNFTGGIANGGQTYFSLEEGINMNTPPQINSIPEPASLALLGIGLVGVAFARRKST